MDAARVVHVVAAYVFEETEVSIAVAVAVAVAVAAVAAAVDVVRVAVVRALVEVTNVVVVEGGGDGGLPRNGGASWICIKIKAACKRVVLCCAESAPVRVRGLAAPTPSIRTSTHHETACLPCRGTAALLSRLKYRWHAGMSARGSCHIELFNCKSTATQP